MIKTIVLSLCFFALPTYAAPSIIGASVAGGTISHGSTMTITGSAFGTHADNHTGSPSQLNYLWNNFDQISSMTSEVDIGDGLTSQCSTNDCRYEWILMNTGNRGNSSKWLKRVHTFDGGNDNNNGLYKPDSGSYVSYSNISFASFWMKVPSQAESGKFFRTYRDITHNTDGTTNNNLFYFDVGGGNNPDSGFDTTIRTCNYGNITPVADDVWRKYDVVQDTNSVRVWIDGQLESTCTYPPTGNWADWGEPNGTIQFVLGIGKDGGGTANTNYYGYDDYYLDLTQARVEIGNASTWAASTHREIQIPKSWADGSLSVQVNKGSFSDGQAFLYVVDSSGAVSDYNESVAGSQGFPITLGGSGSTDVIAPAAPSGLSVR